jgi:hypothetical protein
MEMKMKCHFIAVLFILLSILCLDLTKSQTISCNKRTFKRVDEISAKLLSFGNSGRKFPETPQDVPKYCA